MASIRERSSAGNPSFHVQIRRKNGHKAATFKTKEEAVEWARKVEGELDRRKYGMESQDESDMLFIDAIDKYIIENIPSLSIMEQSRRKLQLNTWRKQFEFKLLKEITPKDIEGVLFFLTDRHQKQFKKKISPATLNRYIAALSHLYTIAIKHWQIIQYSPTQQVHRPDSQARIRFSNSESSKHISDLWNCISQKLPETSGEYLVMYILMDDEEEAKENIQRGLSCLQNYYEVTWYDKDKEYFDLQDENAIIEYWMEIPPLP